MSAHFVLRHRTGPGASTAVLDQRRANLSARLTGASMRILEMALALGAIATALLIGVGR